MRTLKVPVTLILSLLIGFGVAAAAHADSVYHTLEFTLKPDSSPEFLELMKIASVDTRKFKGCEYFAILVDRNDPQKIFFYEIWETEEDHAAYRKWRADTKFGSKVQPFLAGPPVRNAYTLFQE